jgi:hypothetical protein
VSCADTPRLSGRCRIAEQFGLPVILKIGKGRKFERST